jgi:hypothetical protein
MCQLHSQLQHDLATNSAALREFYMRRTRKEFGDWVQRSGSAGVLWIERVSQMDFVAG